MKYNNITWYIVDRCVKISIFTKTSICLVSMTNIFLSTVTMMTFSETGLLKNQNQKSFNMSPPQSLNERRSIKNDVTKADMLILTSFSKTHQFWGQKVLISMQSYSFLFLLKVSSLVNVKKKNLTIPFPDSPYFLS